ncbi:MAG: ATPase, T2SS/T4P/T4SS family, partial [Calditrichaceae bacterium]
ISNLDIAETRKPQDGQAKVTRGNASIDLRISILPMSYGEKVVIRILDSRKGSIPLEKLGISGENLQKLNRVLDLRQGIILATGPTGSGKTTTLYAALNRIKSPEMNILTIEDPIEYSIEDINQVQVNIKAGITFASALRSFLRQDPDVILVGEIRDPETAEISIQAALTGHLVLSTVHTNSALETITRLIDIGIDRYKVTSALSGVIGQRLVRKVCTSCREEVNTANIDEHFLKKIRDYHLPEKIYKSKGCAKCDFTGYKGRVGLYEILILDAEIKSKIEQSAPIAEIEKAAVKKGFKNFSRSALELITSGVTDIAEVKRVITLEIGDDFEVKTESVKKPEISSSKQVESKGIDVNKTIEEKIAIKKKILVVDDNKIMQKMVKTLLLKENKYEVDGASDGIEALEKIEKNIPDLIVLDVMMPRMDGYEVCKKLRESDKYADLPIIMLTSLDGKEDILKAFNMGVDDFISKPVDNNILSAKVASLLRRSDIEKSYN